MRSVSAPKMILFAMVVWLALLGCYITDTIAMARPTPTKTIAPIRTAPRPTFTAIPPTLELPPTVVLPVSVPTNTVPRPSPTRTSAPRPAPTRASSVPPVAPAPVATVDLYEGYFYRVLKNVCATANNTRIEGTVLNNGSPQNGVRVRLSNGKYDTAVIDDFVTGTDPSDAKHIDPEWQGRYRLSPAEGQRIDGNWWVFIIDNAGQPISVAAYIKTHDGPGCNTATVDFAH